PLPPRGGHVAAGRRRRGRRYPPHETAPGARGCARRAGELSRPLERGRAAPDPASAGHRKGRGARDPRGHARGARSGGGAGAGRAGERPPAVARELTRVFEETRAGPLEELAGYYAAAPPRGEVTVLVAGVGKRVREEEPPPDAEARARALLAQGMTRRDVADQLAAETGITRNTAYRLVNEL